MGSAKVLKDLHKKEVKWNKKLEIYINGSDNAYPEVMERLLNNSVTASMASAIMIQYCIGKGLGADDEKLIGNQKLIDIAHACASDIVRNRGVFIHVNYDANFDATDFKVIPFNQCRVGLKDSKEYNGKILVAREWTNNTKLTDISVLDVYNKDKKVIEAQVNACQGRDLFTKISRYKGQILFYSMDPQYYYPLARIDSVASECDNEYLASRYKNILLRDGFVGKTLVITRPLIENDLIERATAEGADPELKKELQQAESERDDFQKGIQDFCGIEGVGGVLHTEMEFDGEKMEDAIVFKNIESNMNDKMFAYSESSAVEKILMTFNNQPIILVKSPESAFGNSGESLKIAKETYYENTFKERDIIQNLLTSMLRAIGDETVVRFIPLITKEVNQDDATKERAKAQAQLKGSVGGITALLSIQTAVANKTTTPESGVAMIVEIFGIEESIAKIILGTPQTIVDPNKV